MRRLKEYLIGKEVTINDKPEKILKLKVAEGRIFITTEDYENIILINNYITEYLEEPLLDIPNYTSQGRQVIAQTGYTGNGVILAIYDIHKDIIIQGEFSDFF